jgi:hypothetical protein
MAFLSLIASLTQRAVVVSDQVLDSFDVPPFVYDDNLIGEVAVISETGDPTAPSQPVAIDASNGVAITDGQTVVYANAIIMSVSDVNKVNFTMVVNSDALVAAMVATTDDFIPAFLEVRIVKDSQDILLLREPIVVQKAATTVGPLPPAGVRGVLYRSDIVALRDDPASLEALSTLLPAPLPPLTLLLIAIGGSVSDWIWTPGQADPDNPDGEVQSLDWNIVTNNFHWAKGGGL